MTTTPTTLEDVARLAGVSRATASRVLLRRGRFSQASRDKVEHAARQLGYVPNVLASDLASKTGPDTVGLLLRDATTPAYGLLFSCLQEQARRHELTMVTMTVVGDPDNTGQMDAIRRLLGLQVRALVIATGSVPSEDIAPYSRDVWMIRAGRPEPTGLLNAISYDEHAHGRFLADRVWDMGHRHVLVHRVEPHVSLPEHHRSHAMATRLTELGATVVDLDVSTLDETAAADVSLDLAVAEQATCVMCPSDLRLLGLLRQAHPRGLDLGRDLSATGCDGILPGVDVMGLTTIRLPVEQVARRTMDHVAAAIAGTTEPLVAEHLSGDFMAGRTLGPLN